MKKKLVAVLLAVATTICIIALSGCGFFAWPKPTIKSVTENLHDSWSIDLPKNITLLNYAENFSIDDGFYYYIFNYDGSDENFNKLFAYEKNEEFEQKFLSDTDLVKNHFVEEYKIPDLSENYKWNFTKGETDRKYLYMLQFSDKNQLIVYIVSW